MKKKITNLENFNFKNNLKMITVITTTVLVASILATFYLARKTHNDGVELLSAIACILLIGVAFLHVLALSTKTINYESLAVERASFQSTLDNSRGYGNQYESATIVTEIVKWNADLAKRKYLNKSIVYGQYIDDRIETISPVK